MLLQFGGWLRRQYKRHFKEEHPVEDKDHIQEETKVENKHHVQEDHHVEARADPPPPQDFRNPASFTLTALHLVNDRINPPPPYNCLSPASYTLTPLGQSDRALAGTLNAIFSATAITAHALAEDRDEARAMKTARKRIDTAVDDIIRSFGFENHHRLVEHIRDGAMSASADTARDVAKSRDPLYTIRLARKTEAEIADGTADPFYFNIIFNFVEPRLGYRLQSKFWVEPRTGQRTEAAEQGDLKTEPRSSNS